VVSYPNHVAQNGSRLEVDDLKRDNLELYSQVKLVNFEGPKNYKDKQTADMIKFVIAKFVFF
jgi:hypothetical protein